MALGTNLVALVVMLARCCTIAAASIYQLYQYSLSANSLAGPFAGALARETD